MALFDPRNTSRSERHRKLFALYEIAYTTVDVSAALFFIVGSILFFSSLTTDIATWLFLIGSLLFALRPTTKLMREIHYWRLEKYDEI